MPNYWFQYFIITSISAPSHYFSHFLSSFSFHGIPKWRIICYYYPLFNQFSTDSNVCHLFFLKKTKRRFLIHFTNTICISISFVFRSKTPVGVRSERSTISSNDCTYQSAKRQRLENGHLNKVWYSFQAEMRGLPNFDVLFSPQNELILQCL